ncbi:MAG TPA: NfeD family protein, partial [Blastocatellia bacterium]|nr:NfeD family protein [Blastocatellia bacterium]
WLVIGALFAAGEAATAGFFLLWFAVGALAAALVALLGISSLTVQVFVFLIVSILLLIASRTIFEKYLNRASLKTGVDTMIGQIGTVVEPSQGARGESAVRVYGSVWTAIPMEGEEPLQVGEAVCVERIDGNTIYVYRPGHKMLGTMHQS